MEAPAEFKKQAWEDAMGLNLRHEIYHGIHPKHGINPRNKVPQTAYTIPEGLNADTPLGDAADVGPFRAGGKGQPRFNTYGERLAFLKNITTNVELLPRVAEEMRLRISLMGAKGKAHISPEQALRWMREPLHPHLEYWQKVDPEGYKKWLDSGWPADAMMRSVEHKPRPSAAPGLSYPPSERTLMA